MSEEHLNESLRVVIGVGTLEVLSPRSLIDSQVPVVVSGKTE